MEARKSRDSGAAQRSTIPAGTGGHLAIRNPASRPGAARPRAGPAARRRRRARAIRSARPRPQPAHRDPAPATPRRSRCGTGRCAGSRGLRSGSPGPAYSSGSGPRSRRRRAGSEHGQARSCLRQSAAQRDHVAGADQIGKAAAEGLLASWSGSRAGPAISGTAGRRPRRVQVRQITGGWQRL